MVMTEGLRLSHASPLLKRRPMRPWVTGIPCGRVVECEATRHEGAVMMMKPLTSVRTRGCMRPWREPPGREEQGAVQAAARCPAAGGPQR
jgi:hypothetical protein